MNDSSRSELLLENVDRSQQRALMSLAHYFDFEYEYHPGCARVFRSTIIQDFSSQLSSNPGSGPISLAETGIPPSSHGFSSSQAPAQLFTTEGTGSLYNPPDDHPLLPHWPPDTMPTNNGALTEQPATGLSNSVFTLDVMSAMPYPAFTSPLGEFIGDQQQCGPASTQNFQARSSYQDVIDIDPFGLDASMGLSNTSTTMLNTCGIFDDDEISASLDWLPAPNYNCTPPLDNLVSPGSSSATPLSPTGIIGEYFHSGKAASRPGSLSSLHSERGRRRNSKVLKRSSNSSMYSAGMGEQVFDSNQTRSSSRASSGRSGRTGPLSKLARAGMRAIKAIGGACWRCKILGKKVSSSDDIQPAD